MSDVNQSVEISYSADISGLVDQLKKIPGISKSEAEKMAKSLKKGFKDTAKEAERASKKSTKSMKRMQTAARNTARSFSAIRRSASQVGRGFAELSLIAGGTDTKFGQLVDNLAMLSIGGSVAIGTIQGLATASKALGGPLTLLVGGAAALAGGIAYATGALDGMTGPTKEQEKALKELEERLKKYRKEIELSAEASKKHKLSIQTATDALRAQETELDLRIRQIKSLYDPSVLEGIAELEESIALEKAKDDAKKNYMEIETGLTDLLTSQKKGIIANKELSIEAAKELTTMQKNMLGLGQSVEYQEFNKLTDEQLDKVKRAADQYRTSLKIDKDLGTGAAKIAGKEFLLDVQDVANVNKFVAAFRDYYNLAESAERTEKEITEHQKNRGGLLDRITQKMKSIFQAQKDAAEYEAESSEELERQAKIREWVSKEKARKADISAKVIELEKTENKLIEAGLSKEEKKQLALYKQIEALHELKKEHDKLIKAGEEELDISLALAGVEEARERIAAEKRQALENQLEKHEKKRAAQKTARAEREQKEIDEATKKQVAGTDIILKNNQKTVAALIQFEQQKSKVSEKAVHDLFNLQKSLAMAEISMSAAKGMALAVANYGPAIGALVGASILASSAAQMAAVSSQKPPSVSGSAHMGGTIQPDERVIRVLTGEAVLDRRTVASLGGEAGVRKLQENKTTGSEVIILNTYKHFDRYNRSAQKRKSRTGSTGSRGY